MSEEPIYDKARGETPTPTGTMDSDSVQRMIDQALQRQAVEHDAEMNEIRGQLATARAALPATLIPMNAGGVGVDTIADTWSQYDQDLANRGQHPLQLEET
jgi:hypothetical protein